MTKPPLSVQELIDLLRDYQHLAWSHHMGRYDCGIVGPDNSALRIEGRYNLEAVVKKINERMG